MLLTFIASFYITFVLLYSVCAYKAYCKGQKAATEMLQYNTYYQVQGMQAGWSKTLQKKLGFLLALCLAYISIDIYLMPFSEWHPLNKRFTI